MNVQEALQRLHSTVEWKVVMEAIDRSNLRPRRGRMKPKESIEQQAAQMLFDQGRQDGFDLLMNFLTRGK